MSEAIQDAISALEDERTVMDQKITAVRDAVLEQIDDAIDTLRGIAGGSTKAKKVKRAARTLRPSVRPSVRPAKAAARSLPNQPKASTSTAEPRPRLDVVPARDAAIVAALKKGPASTSTLKDALPKESGQTNEQRQSAVTNALTRLKVKKVIKPVDRGEWALT